MMGWNGDFLQEAVDTCTNLSGQIEDCPLFTIQDSSVYGNCNITLPSVLAKENVVGAITTMPGNPAIAYGPAYASGAAAGKSATTPATSAAPVTTQPAMTLSYSAGASLASTDTYVPGAIFALSSGASFTQDTTTSSAITTSTSISSAPAVTEAAVFAEQASSAETMSYFSTAYNTISSNQVEEVLWVEEVVTVTQESTSTVVVGGESKKIRKRHGHGVHGHARR